MLLLSVFAGAHVSAQRRTVTNAELEKYKQKRLQAERDYNDNFDQMGFPSPEELQRQIEQGRADSLALSERLAAERIERERLQIERDRLAIDARTALGGREEYPTAGYSTLNDGYTGWVFRLLHFGGNAGRFAARRIKVPRAAVNIATDPAVTTTERQGNPEFCAGRARADGQNNLNG